MDTMAAIRQTFFEECEEQLTELEEGLLAIEREEGDEETINAVFRAVHSIKGGAGAFGLDDLVRFAHAFETTLDGMRAGTLATTPQILHLMLRSADILADLVRIARDGGEIDADRVALMSAELDKAGGAGAAGGAAALPTAPASISSQTFPETDEFGFAPTPVTFDFSAQAQDDALQTELTDEFGFAPVRIDFSDILAGDDETGANPAPLRVRFTPTPGLYAKANDALRLLRELQRLGETEIICDTSAVPLLGEIDPEGAYLSWDITLGPDIDEAAVREVFEFVEYDCELSIETVATAPLMDEIQADKAVDAILKEVAAIPDHVPAVTIAETATIVAPEPAPVLAAIANNPPFHQQVPQPAPQAAPQPATQQSATIRVDLDRVDRMIDLVGELVINQSMLAQRVQEAGIARLSEVSIGLDDLEQLTREIQDSVMAIRAQPVRPIFQRMSRVVREIADMTGKSARLVTEGENCEVDKTVIERLADPLTHMIRNAIDHGLESPQERLKAGKPEYGVVRMVAAHRSGRVVIEVSDDGAGIDRARVRQIAIDRGIITEDALLSDAETDDLIFAPGFSTAASVSDVSGRGVGMDVVRRSIQALGGRITIASRPGEGATFTLSLPLTLAVLDGMVVTAAGQTLVVPLSAIVETLQPRSDDVHNLGEKTRLINIRGAFIPLIDIGCVLGYRHEEPDAITSVAIMVETDNQTQCALMVDGIIGQQQVVIKSLETNYGHVFGVAGATILGDGRVAVILDVDAIITSARGEAARRRNAA